MSEYDPQPPFNAGLPRTAPPEAVKPMMEPIADFREQAEAVAGVKASRYVKQLVGRWRLTCQPE